VIIHNTGLARLIPAGDYRACDLARIESTLRDHGTLTFVRLPSGLYSACSAGASIEVSGYGNVWVRDNFYVALAQHVTGKTQLAVDTVRALLAFYSRHHRRFDDIIAGKVDPHDVAKRPHVRFDGGSLDELPERWPHAQNDSFGYVLWLASKLAAGGDLVATADAISVLHLMPRYLEAIRFWEDEDSGHWEEQRKISASSIGTVVAGLEALLELIRLASNSDWRQLTESEYLIVSLIERGRAALDAILPCECVQAGGKNRLYDAALLFLLFPLEVVRDEMVADQVLQNTVQHLAGEHGVRRYPGDSYWAPDYDLRLSVTDQTRDFSEDMESRDALLPRIGDEARWCLFDPILSAFFGRRFLRTKSIRDRERQIHHFNRSLAQITDDWHCAELYYLRHGSYVSNPQRPLQWTQANLLLALDAMHSTLASIAPNTSSLAGQ
jgi:phosphorylase kinase alpha/beta subunit